jgi:uncharacterized protein YdeI (YjbR/CyaY-like superfamily)
MPKVSPQDYEQVHPADRATWRDWLEQNHTTSPGVWLILNKKGRGGSQLSLRDAMDEAICFGWIDSREKGIDAERYMLTFTPRKVGSNWSKVNKGRIEELVEQGLMHPLGLAKIEAAKLDGSWSRLDAVEDLQAPPDLEAALAANDVARGYFNAFSNSSKKMVLMWIETAKRPETRAKRIAETVRLAEQNIKANQ